MSVIDNIRAALGNKDNKDSDVAVNSGFSAYSWLVCSDEDPLEKRRIRHRRCLAVSVAVLITGIAAFLIASAGGTSSGMDAGLLERREKGREVDLHLKLEYEGSELEKDLSVSVLPKHISSEDSERLFDECESWIRAQFSEKLWFPEIAPNGVSIIWQDDAISFLGPRDSEKTLVAQLSAGEFFRVCSFRFTGTLGSAEHLQGLEALSEKLADDLNRNDEGSALLLPDDAQGARLRWSLPGKNAPVLVVPVCAFAAAFIWMSRDDAEKRSWKKRRAAFENEIPAMSFQVMLLLNAGLIAESAFTQLIAQTAGEQGILYRIFRDIKQRSLQRNVPFISELYDFARGSHCGSLLRFALLVKEHASRGASLADKLEQERNMMLGSRMSSARAKVKEAETKLCLPLILLLISLIIITAVPSFMAM